MTDSHIIIYAYNPTDPVKKDRAWAFVEKQIADGTLIVSTQVLHEFYNRATKPNKPPSLSHEDAVVIINKIIVSVTVHPLSLPVTKYALYAIKRYQMSLWDALIWATAKEYGDTVIYTEDIQSQPEIEGVRYINPLL